MKVEEIKKLYDSGDWIVIWKHKLANSPNRRNWAIDETQGYFDDEDVLYKLIHKKHKEILDAYLEGRPVRVDNGGNNGCGCFYQLGSHCFIESYDVDMDWLIEENNPYVNIMYVNYTIRS